MILARAEFEMGKTRCETLISSIKLWKCRHPPLEVRSVEEDCEYTEKDIEQSGEINCQMRPVSHQHQLSSIHGSN